MPRLSEITNVHQWMGSHQWPGAYHRDGTTYATLPKVDADNDVLRIQVISFDHTRERWSPKTEITTVTPDRHYMPRILVSESGWVYVFTGARGEFDVWRSTQQHSIQNWEDQGAVSGTQDYFRGTVDGENLYLVSRDGNSNYGTVTLNTTTDNGQSWSYDTVIDDSDRAMYPFSSGRDGDLFHILTAARKGGSSGFEYLCNFYYDIDQGTYHGPSGTEITTPATKSDLSAADAIVDEEPSGADDGTVIGSGLALNDNGRPHIAYMKGDVEDTVSPVSARWDGSDWVQQGEIAGIDFSSQWGGQSLQLVDDSENLILYETATNREGTETSVGRFESTDGGGSWSAREDVVDDGLDDGYFGILPVANANDWKWMLTETVDPNSAGPDEGGGMFAYSESWTALDGSVFTVHLGDATLGDVTISPS